MNQSFDVETPVELEIRLASGTITVDASLDGRVEVELIAYDEESQRIVETARIERRDHDRYPTILVDVPQKKGFGLSNLFGRAEIECRVRCPHDSGLSVRTKSADVTARGTFGGLNVATASGDVEIDRVSGGVNVKSASSDFAAREIGGGANVQTASGDIEIEVARGPVNLTSVSGDITIGEAYDNVSANTVSGDQGLGAVMRGAVATQAVSGDVTIGVRRGSKAYLDCSTISGDTSSELDMTGDVPAGDGPLVEIRARTVSGDIRITRAPAPTDTQEVHA